MNTFLCVASLMLLQEAEPAAVVLGKDPRGICVEYSMRFLKEPEQTILQIANDGTVTAAGKKTVRIRLSQDELKDVLHTIVHQHRFFDWTEERVRTDAAVIQNTANTALNARMTVRLADRVHVIECWPLSPGKRIEKLPCLSHVAAIQNRMIALAASARIGGAEGVQKALRVANEALKEEFPLEKPLTRADIVTDLVIQANVPEGWSPVMFRRVVGDYSDRSKFSVLEIVVAVNGDNEMKIANFRRRFAPAEWDAWAKADHQLPKLLEQANREVAKTRAVVFTMKDFEAIRWEAGEASIVFEKNNPAATLEIGIRQDGQIQIHVSPDRR